MTSSETALADCLKRKTISDDRCKIQMLGGSVAREQDQCDNCNILQSLFTLPLLQTALFSIVNTKYREYKIRGKVKFKYIYLHLRVTACKCYDVMLVSRGNVIFEAVTILIKLFEEKSNLRGQYSEWLLQSCPNSLRLRLASSRLRLSVFQRLMFRRKRKHMSKKGPKQIPIQKFTLY